MAQRLLRPPAERIFPGSSPGPRFLKMKTYTEKIVINTEKRIDFVNITSKVQDIVRKSGVNEGLVLVNPMHITASVFINDAESGLIKDFENWLEKLAPKNFDYNHHQTGEDNGFSHLWRTIIGRESCIAITNSNLDFGPWEQIFYGEFDGQRDKRILVKVIGE
jgi:secondary thiamine-phosphate synthase enzyme